MLNETMTKFYDPMPLVTVTALFLEASHYIIIVINTMDCHCNKLGAYRMALISFCSIKDCKDNQMEWRTLRLEIKSY